MGPPSTRRAGGSFGRNIGSPPTPRLVLEFDLAHALRCGLGQDFPLEPDVDEAGAEIEAHDAARDSAQRRARAAREQQRVLAVARQREARALAVDAVAPARVVELRDRGAGRLDQVDLALPERHGAGRVDLRNPDARGRAFEGLRRETALLA